MTGKFKILFLAILFLTFFAGDAAFAFFGDNENSADNVYSAGSLDFLLDSPNDFSPSVTPTQSSIRNIVVEKVNQGNLNFQYTVGADNFVGNSDSAKNLCNHLNLTADLGKDGIYEYSGPLTDFSSYNAGEFSAPEEWEFTLTLISDDPELQDETCAFDLVFDGVQLGPCNGFSDIEILSNIISSGVWQETPPEPVCGNYIVEGNETCDDGNTVDGDGCSAVCQLEDLTPLTGEIIINEVMWMGSASSTSDEWIELRNTTDHDIDISNWNIIHGGAGVNSHIEIPDGYSIKANGFFLIIRKKWDETKINLTNDLDQDKGYTHVSGMNLFNGGESLILEDKDDNIIDTAWKYEKWPAGTNGMQKQSMERNDIPGDGLLAASWHTCIDESCNDTTYWDDEGNNCGTPGHANLSANDPSSDDYQENQNIGDENIGDENIGDENVENGKVEKFEEEFGEGINKVFDGQAENAGEENNEKDTDEVIEDKEEKGGKTEDESDGAASKEEGDVSDVIIQGEEFGNNDGDDDEGKEGDSDDNDSGDGEEGNKDKPVDGIQPPETNQD